MPLLGSLVPEPEASKEEEDLREQMNQVHVAAISTDEDNDDDLDDNPENNGYQPIPSALSDPVDLSSDEEELPPTYKEEQPRELKVDSDLVKDAMKHVKLSVSSIPPWAKEISNSAWNEVVRKTITGGDIETDFASSSTQMEQPPS
ncbi:uncharacterized protein LOC143463045 [Clavelina lepadiformis]|uniref:uncharacterized protein LOC143463045 n=1 Tax=Clavelina lepadiformis TaxID=159417 RepID=UPI00404259E9